MRKILSGSFRLRLADSADSQAQANLSSVSHTLDNLYEGSSAPCPSWRRTRWCPPP